MTGVQNPAAGGPDRRGLPADADDDLDPEFTQLDCSAVLADVWLLLDNECDPAARARLQGHLDTCPSCLEHYGIEQQLKALINRKCGGEQAPPGLADRLRVEIRRTVVVTDGTISETTVTETTVTEATTLRGERQTGA